MNKPLFKPLIDSFPGLAEELKALDVAQPQQEPTQREPLTDDEFISMVDSAGIVIDPILAFEIKEMVEAAHGITGEQNATGGF